MVSEFDIRALASPWFGAASSDTKDGPPLGPQAEIQPKTTNPNPNPNPKRDNLNIGSPSAISSAPARPVDGNVK